MNGLNKNIFWGIPAHIPGSYDWRNEVVKFLVLPCDKGTHFIIFNFYEIFKKIFFE